MARKALRRKISVGFQVVLDPSPEGGFVVHCPALRGCHSQGETEAEALANIQEAIEGWLLARGERGTIKVSAADRS